MGKQSKQTEAEQRRQYLAALRRQEEEKQKRQQRLMWQIAIAVIALILIVVVVTVTIVLRSNHGSDDGTDSTVQTSKHDPNHIAPLMEELDFSSVALENTTLSDTPTDYVKLNISYTDLNGTQKTGDVILRLFENVAPKTVANFKALVADEFYDGLIFHRIIEDFMIQGGAANSSSVSTIVGEFESNGFKNNLLHVRGVVSMARTNVLDSASSQFFIVHETAEHLDGKYAAFGYVVYGMETVDGIATTPVNGSDYPLSPVTINYAVFVNVTD